MAVVAVAVAVVARRSRPFFSLFVTPLRGELAPAQRLSGSVRLVSTSWWRGRNELAAAGEREEPRERSFISTVWQFPGRRRRRRPASTNSKRVFRRGIELSSVTFAHRRGCIIALFTKLAAMRCEQVPARVAISRGNDSFFEEKKRATDLLPPTTATTTKRGGQEKKNSPTFSLSPLSLLSLPRPPPPNPKKTPAVATPSTSSPFLPAVTNGARWTAMRHGNRLNHLGRPADQRKALVRTLTTEVLRHGRITTTKVRAKAIRKYVDKMIGLAKDGSLHARRQALAFLYDADIVDALFAEAGERYGSRPGGYCRVVAEPRRRRGDAAELAAIELV